jgi:DHA1 family tetracycline resistance protein-like MFS transporter
MTIIIPLLPLYAVSFQSSAFMIGVLGAAYPVMQFIGAPILGRLSDRLGRKPVLLFSQVGTLIGFIILGLAGNLWMLFISRILDGLSGANIATAQAAIADSTNEKTRTQGLGLIGAAFGMGFVIGPVIAAVSLALSGNNYHVPAWVAAGASLASILLTYFWLPETLPVEQRSTENNKKAGLSLASLVQALRHPQVGLLLVVIFVQQIAFGGFEQLLALFTLNRMGLNASGNAIIFVYIGIIVVVVQGGLIGPWSRKFGDRRLVFGGLLALALGLSLTGLTPRQPMPGYSKAALEAELIAGSSFRTHENPTTTEVEVDLPEDDNNGWGGLAWMLVAMIPASIGGGILQPSLNSLITKRIEAGEIGGMLGISAALLSGANAVAPVFFGAIFQYLGAPAPFLIGGLLLGVLLALAIVTIKPGKEESAPVGLMRGRGGH